ALRAGWDRSRPQARMVPAVGRSRPTIMRAMVVLPEPDSPTIASDPRSGITNDASWTAVTSPNVLVSPATSRTASAMAHQGRTVAQLAGPHAAHLAAGQFR